MKARKSKRSAIYRNLRIAPECRDDPDIEKLGRTLIAVARRTAAKKKAGKQPAGRAEEGGDAP